MVSRSPSHRRSSRSRDRGEDRESRRTLEKWVDRLLVVTVAGSLLVIGSVHVPVLAGVSVLAIGTGILAMYAHKARTGVWPIGLPALAIGALTLWTLVQAIPMPVSLLAKLAPKNAEVWAYALSPLGEPGPSWATISLAPGATWVEVLKGLTYFGVVVAATSVAARRGAAFGVATVFFSGLAAAVVTVLHGLAGMTKVYGIYEPVNAFPRWSIGPLLNGNHLAGYLNLATMSGVGLILMHRPVIPRWVVGLGVATMIGVMVASGSRGAVVLLPIGVGAAVLLARARASKYRVGRDSGRVLSWLTLGAAGGGVVLAVLGMTTQQWNALMSRDASKLNIMEWAKPLIRDHLLTGIGRGAFETVYPAYRPIPGNLVWTHPENIAVQWLSEWGLPLGVAGLLGFFWLVGPSRMSATRSGLAAGAWAGIFVLFLQNWVDFSLEIPSVAIAVSVLIGAFWGDGGRRGLRSTATSAARSGRFSGIRNALRSRAATLLPATPWVLGVVGCLVLVKTLSMGMPTAEGYRRTLHAQATSDTLVPKDVFRSELRRVLLRYPGDPYFSLVGAIRARRGGDDNPIPYLQRALERSKVYGRAHLLTADVLFARGAQNQALMELRFACRDESSLTSEAIDRAIAHTTEFTDLMRMVPDGRLGTNVMDALGGWLHDRNPDAGHQMDEEVLRRDPSRLGPRRRALDDLLSQVDRAEKGERCTTEDAMTQCIAEAEKRIQELTPYVANGAEISRLRARLYQRLGRFDEASHLLETACDALGDSLVCYQQWVDVESHRNNDDGVDRLLQKIVSMGCHDMDNCSRTWRWVGAFCSRTNRLGRAVNAYEKAVQQAPTDWVSWEDLGGAASRLGTHARAARAYSRAAELRHGDQRLRDLADRERRFALDMGTTLPK